MQFCPNINPPCYKSNAEDNVIAAEDEIRLKIVGTRVDAGGIVSFNFFLYYLSYYRIILIVFIFSLLSVH